MELYANVDAFRTYEGALYCLQCGKPYNDEKKRCFELAEITRKEANTPSRVVSYKPSGFGVHPGQSSGQLQRANRIHSGAPFAGEL